MRIIQNITNLIDIYRSQGAESTFTRYLNYVVRLIRTYKLLWTPRRLYVPLESISIDRPMFVLGTQGAGLTLLTRMIRRNPDVVMIGGGPSFWTGFDEMDKHPIGHADFPDALSLRAPGYKNMTGRENEHSVFGLERSWVYATDALLATYKKTAEDVTDEVCTAIRRKIQCSIRAYAFNIQRARFLDKSQSYALKIPLIKKCLPSALFVVQTRDPYVMCWREVTRQPEHKYKYWKTRPSLEAGLHYAAQHWKNTYEIAFNDLKGQPYGLFIRFEDLISKPEQTLRHVLRFLDLEYNQDLLPHPSHKMPLGSNATEKWYPIRNDANKMYLRSITPEACKIIQDEIGNIAEMVGYLPPIPTRQEHALLSCCCDL